MNIPDSYILPVMKRYASMKQEALINIKKLAGDSWTDFNLHDPGITILENICASIIDLEYRANFSIADILAIDPNSHGKKDRILFYSAEEILPCNPWSINDFRKIIADVPGVYNVQVYTSDPRFEIQGGYKIFIAKVEDEMQINSTNETFLKTVLEKIHKNRNLCEDFFEVSILEPKEIHIAADIDLKKTITQEEAIFLVANILFEIENFLVPFINFHTLSEMLIDRDYSVEEIYSGPLLEHGFIDDKELESSQIKQAFHTSEFIEIIIKNQNVRSLLNLHLYSDDDERAKNYLKISPREIFKLNVKKCCITLYNNGLPMVVNIDRVFQIYKDLNMKRSIKAQSLPNEEIAHDTGNYRNLYNYCSIQNDFPLIYGVGIEGVAKNASNIKKSSTNQLKAFLLIFDQLFANYLTKLNNAKLLLSIHNKKEKNYQTQLPSQVPYLEEILKYISTDNENNIEFITQRILLNIEIDDHKKKKYLDDKVQGCYNYTKKIHELKLKDNLQIDDSLNFILSVFSESFSTIPTMLKTTSDEDSLLNIIDAKKKFLIDYIAISNDATKSFNLLAPSANSRENSAVSGFEKRLCKSLDLVNFADRSLCKDVKEAFYMVYNADADAGGGQKSIDQKVNSWQEDLVLFEGNFPRIKNLVVKFGVDIANYEIIETEDLEYKIILYIDRPNNKFLSLKSQLKITKIKDAENIVARCANFYKNFNSHSEGFYIVEHILLRTETAVEKSNDPYSFTLTIALPSWPVRFQMQDFKNIFYKTVLENIPAHIYVNILWLDVLDMETFEKAYKAWYAMRTKASSTPEMIKKTSQTLMGLILMYGNDNT